MKTVTKPRFFTENGVALSNADRINKCAPNMIELTRNFRFVIDLNTDEAVARARELAESIEAGTSNPKPGDNIERLSMHVARGVFTSVRRSRDDVPGWHDRALWIREAVDEEVRNLLSAELGPCRDLSEERMAEMNRRQQAFEEAEARKVAEREAARRPAFDRDATVSYQSGGAGNVSATTETPVVILLKLGVKPAELKPYGEVRTWRDSAQRVLLCSSEVAGLEAIEKFAPDIRNVFRLKLNDDYPWALPVAYEKAKTLPVNLVEDKHDKWGFYALSDEDAALVKLSFPDAPLLRTLNGKVAA